MFVNNDSNGFIVHINNIVRIVRQMRYLSASVTGWLTAFSASLSRHPYTKLENHMSQIADAPGDQKKLFKIAKLLHTDNGTAPPTCDSFNMFAEQFSDLFLRLNLENPVRTYSKC